MDQLARKTVQRIGTRRYRLRSEVFSVEFLHSPRTVFCLACLSEDDQTSGAIATTRRHRLAWMLSVVRTCPKHGIGLVAVNKQRWSDPLNELAIRVPEVGPSLKARSDAQPVRSPSDLQRYILERLDGEPGPEWLDGQSVEQVVRTAEMLGVTILQGAKPNLDKVGMDEWDAAGRAGFDFMKRGPDGLINGFQHILKANAGPAQAGPQSVFGRLYQWLQFGRSTKDPGPVRDLLRDFITQHFAIPAGSVIFGTVLERRRLHTATSLSRECDVNRKTLHKLLVARGLVADADIEGAAFDAAQGEQLADIVKHLIGYKQLPKFFNYSRTRVDQLIEAGLIKPIDGRPPDPSQVRVIGFDRREVEDFLNRLARRATIVEQASEGMVSIADAMFPGIKAVEIIQNILAGHLSAVERLISVPGINGLLVNPMEVKALLNKQEKLLSPRQAAIRLHLDISMMPCLLGEGSEPAILNVVGVKLRKVAGTKRMVPKDAILEFERTYVSLCGIASETGRHFRTVMKELDEMQIKVVRRGMKPTAAVYLRSAVPWSRFSR